LIGATLRNLVLALVAVCALSSCQRAPVELNSANRKDLETVKEIGPRTAEEIVKERKRGGDFKDWNDFIGRVKGVGEKSAAQMSADGLTINGQKMSEAGAPAAPK
jgi:competence protein ComEA